uniref:3-dehydrosphinganine reductase n=1 Tax=Bionectria ochroleuca TaxID=29856 RepID=A0A8H7MY16_BIOOC
MGNSFSSQFPVSGRTVVITGGSQGMGLEAGRQLARKGASIVIVARNIENLKSAIKIIAKEASSRETQRFHYVSADLSSESECVRVIGEVEEWNGALPDVVWCVAGSSRPQLFIDAPASSLDSHMKNNFFSSAYMAHAILSRWLRPADVSTSKKTGRPADRHLIFTSSLAALYPIIGYGLYSPSKLALRGLSDALSQEMNLYNAAHPNEPRVRLHTIYPGTILTSGYEGELSTKPDVQKSAEEVDLKQTADVVAAKSIAGLESGREFITTDIVASLARQSLLGNTPRGGFLQGLLDAFMAGIISIAVLIVRWDMDRQVSAWGRKYGTSAKVDLEQKVPK